ncbi:MAG: gluconate 2-dehydrogenase subunit 3 family protein [Balneolales bacterium]
MDRREHLKLLLAGSVGAGLFVSTSCSEADRAESEEIIAQNTYGRTPEEIDLNEKLNAETFFTGPERKAVEVLCDIIIPADDTSGSATDAGVPDFMEFMMKDVPSMQVPTRGGLMWLDNLSKKRFGKTFVAGTASKRLSVIDEIAWPEKAEPEVGYGVRFFNSMRNLTATGYFTSEMGLKDLGYLGNQPNVWDGVPDEILEKHGLAYDQKTLDECIKPEDRNRLAEWDEKGNLVS